MTTLDIAIRLWLSIIACETSACYAKDGDQVDRVFEVFTRFHTALSDKDLSLSIKRPLLACLLNKTMPEVVTLVDENLKVTEGSWDDNMSVLFSMTNVCRQYVPLLPKGH